MHQRNPNKGNDRSYSQFKGDLTGRDRIIWNTVVSWLSQIVVIATGFILPRLMHEGLGQTLLGVWDFAWTFVNYFNLMSLGIGSSVNRFIAKFRSEGLSKKLNELVSTVVVIQICIGLVVVLATFAVYAILGRYYSEKLGENLVAGQSIVILLGLSLAIEMLVNSSRGIITGYHRWDIHNGIYAASSILKLAFMCFVLFADGNIIQLGTVYFFTTLVTESLRIAIAIRIAPEIRFIPALFSLKQAKTLMIFGSKTLLLAFPQVILVQSVNLITVAFLGPAALAIFARPFALIRHLYTLIYKFTMILTPTAGSLQTTGSTEEIRKFFMSTIKFNFSIAIPAIIFFSLFGDVILAIWMGPTYENWPLISILAIGHLLAIGQDGIIRIMQGLNLHGRLGAILFFVVTLSAIFCFVYLNRTPWTLLSSAILLTVPMTVAFGIVLPLYSCKAIHINIGDYMYHTLFQPTLYNFPFISGLILTRYLMETDHGLAALLTLILTISLETVVYYIFLLPEGVKNKIQEMVVNKIYVTKKG